MGESKKKLNPIMKSMNDFRHDVIADKIGSKAPAKTAPVLSLVLNSAKQELGIGKDEKCTLEVVEKAVELFNDNPQKIKDFKNDIGEKLDSKESKRVNFVFEKALESACEELGMDDNSSEEVVSKAIELFNDDSDEFVSQGNKLEIKEKLSKKKLKQENDKLTKKLEQSKAKEAEKPKKKL